MSIQLTNASRQQKLKKPAKLQTPQRLDDYALDQTNRSLAAFGMPHVFGTKVGNDCERAFYASTRSLLLTKSSEQTFVEYLEESASKFPSSSYAYDRAYFFFAGASRFPRCSAQTLR